MQIEQKPKIEDNFNHDQRFKLYFKACWQIFYYYVGIEKQKIKAIIINPNIYIDE